MLLFKQIIPTTVLVLLLSVGTGYGAATDFPLYTVDEAITAKKGNPRTIYVDTRREEEFQTVRIPSSINIPIHFIKTKSYLKNMDIILLNQGYSLSQLQREGELLKDKGFRVMILAGGIAAWHQEGQRLEGDRFAMHALHHISAAELLSEASSSFVKLSVNISSASKNNKILGESLHQAVNGAEDLPKLINSINSRGLDERSGVLIFNEKGDYSLLETLPKQCSPTIFFLNGGMEEYQLKAEQHLAMLQPKEQRIKTFGGCSTCPPASDISDIDKKEETQ